MNFVCQKKGSKRTGGEILSRTKGQGNGYTKGIPTEGKGKPAKDVGVRRKSRFFKNNREMPLLDEERKNG